MHRPSHPKGNDDPVIATIATLTSDHSERQMHRPYHPKGNEDPGIATIAILISDHSEQQMHRTLHPKDKEDPVIATPVRRAAEKLMTKPVDRNLEL